MRFRALNIVSCAALAGVLCLAVNPAQAEETNPCFTGEGTVNIGDGGLKHTFVCTYSVKENGTGTATCDVQFLGKENFAFVLIDRGNEVRFISTTPGAIIKGVARSQ